MSFNIKEKGGGGEGGTKNTNNNSNTNNNNNNNNTNNNGLNTISKQFDWLFIGDPLVESLKVLKEEKQHDLVLLEATLEEIENEIKAFQEKKNSILKGIEKSQLENDKLDNEIAHCKSAVYSKWKSISDRYQLNNNINHTFLNTHKFKSTTPSTSNTTTTSTSILTTPTLINKNANNNNNNNNTINNNSNVHNNINNAINNSNINIPNSNINNSINNSDNSNMIMNEDSNNNDDDDEDHHHVPPSNLLVLPDNVNNINTSKIISTMEPFSLFQLLPLEVMVTIFENLNFHDVHHCVSLVCKQWHNYTFADSIWKNLFYVKWNTFDIHHQNESKPLKTIPSSFWPSSPTSQPPQSLESSMTLPTYNSIDSTNSNYDDEDDNCNNNDENDNYCNSIDINSGGGNKQNKRLRIDWRELFIKRQRIENNWTKGIQKPIKLVGHSDWVTCMQFDGKFLVTGSWDSSLKLWNIETGEETVFSTKELGGHSSGITCVTVRGNRLISGSSDSTLRVWDMATGDCLLILQGHTDGVSCLCMIDDVTLASGSLDNSINLWSIETGKLLHSFTNNTSGISCLFYKNNLLINGTMGGSLNVIDIPSRILLTTFHGHSDRVTSIQWWDSPEGPRIISSSWDYTLRVWNLHTGKTVNLLSGHTFRVRCTQVRGNILASGSWDTTVKVWDLLTGKCIHTLFGHSFNVWSIQFEGNRLVSAGWDKKIKVWDMTTGKELYTLEGHSESIICIQFKGSKLVTAAKEIIVYDFDS